MSKDLHTVALMKGTQLSREDRLIVGQQRGVVNAAGGGAGQAVTTTVTFLGNLPTSFQAMVDPHQDATWYTTNKTANTIDVVLTPRLAANTLAAGTFDITLIG